MEEKRWYKSLYIIALFVFLYLPILVMIIFSFNQSRQNIIFTGFTIDWYGRLWNNQALITGLLNSLVVGLSATFIATIIGTLGAVGLTKYNFIGKNIVNQIVYVPIVIPEVVLGIALLSIFSFFSIPLGLLTLFIAHVTFSVPFVVVSVRAGFTEETLALEEAAMDLGANKRETFTKVTLPALWPAIISGALLSFTLSLDDVIISFFVVGPDSQTLPLAILSMVRVAVTPDVNALATLILIVTVALVFSNGLRQVRKIQKNAQ
ncbi:ABC transporter permease [Lactococcus kimchii]|uniref:ABC transporter permease n=1 Tax=Lactococcus sp. S-13 TaxID=2507158 RepID=UPI001022B262|nr:ABC transporter permease subunit [Lactococcus sp. S-13]RZI48042.1 ABC transporter permease subunit [Lactococcus sp. S-13]